MPPRLPRLGSPKIRRLTQTRPALSGALTIAPWTFPPPVPCHLPLLATHQPFTSSLPSSIRCSVTSCLPIHLPFLPCHQQQLASLPGDKDKSDHILAHTHPHRVLRISEWQP